MECGSTCSGDFAQVEVTAFSPLMGIQGTRPAETGTNSLIALDLATEGKLVWQIGGDQASETPLAGAFLLGCATCRIDDAMYLLAEMSGDITFFASTQQPAPSVGVNNCSPSNQAPSTRSRASRCRCMPSPIKTDCSFVRRAREPSSSVDIHDRSLVWGVGVERNDAINQNVIGRREGFVPDQLLKRWWDSTPMIVDDTVFITPIEADRLFALNLLTGEKRWKEFARTQTASRYLAGVHRGTIILVGGDNVQGVDSRTGKRTWKTRGGWLDSGEQVCGLGMLGTIANPATNAPEPAYFVPHRAIASSPYRCVMALRSRIARRRFPRET
jgi:hypothetical protein